LATRPKAPCRRELAHDLGQGCGAVGGRQEKVRDGIEAWFDAGIKTPIIVPSSAVGNQLKAFEEFFAIWN
jgi:alkanesulfonate monooxygenase SsuD/methylene tetrahydromethanopterin reductase-like flavin-dependent oxidoreductase (luciferase family)